MTVQGLAPFGADIAVLVHNPALDGSSPRRPNNLTAAAALSGGTASDATGVSTELQHERPELKIFTWTREEVAADALSITGTCYACIAFCAHLRGLASLGGKDVTSDDRLDLFCCAYDAACWPVGPFGAPHAGQHVRVHIVTTWLSLCPSEVTFCWAQCHTALYVANRPPGVISYRFSNPKDEKCKSY